MDVKEKVLQVMRSRAALQDKALGGEYPFRMATWNLRLAMEKEFPVNSCPCNGDSQCWVTKGWHETKLIV